MDRRHHDQGEAEPTDGGKAAFPARRELGVPEVGGEEGDVQENPEQPRDDGEEPGGHGNSIGDPSWDCLRTRKN